MTKFYHSQYSCVLQNVFVLRGGSWSPNWTSLKKQCVKHIFCIFVNSLFFLVTLWKILSISFLEYFKPNKISWSMTWHFALYFSSCFRSCKDNYSAGKKQVKDLIRIYLVTCTVVGAAVIYWKDFGWSFLNLFCCLQIFF